MKPDHISQRVKRQCGVLRHLVDRLPIERDDHSVAWQASLPQHSLPPARDQCVRVRISNSPEPRSQLMTHSIGRKAAAVSRAAFLTPSEVRQTY
jgi:hypothetical protein